MDRETSNLQELSEEVAFPQLKAAASLAEDTQLDKHNVCAACFHLVRHASAWVSVPPRDYEVIKMKNKKWGFKM